MGERNLFHLELTPLGEGRPSSETGIHTQVKRIAIVLSTMCSRTKYWKLTYVIRTFHDETDDLAETIYCSQLPKYYDNLQRIGLNVSCEREEDESINKNVTYAACSNVPHGIAPRENV